VPASDPPRPRPSPGPVAPADGRPQAAAQPRIDVQEAFTELGRIVIGDQPLGQVLHRVAELAAACIPGADQVSVTLLDGGRAHSAAFTGSAAAMLDERQYAQGFGPCMDAAASGGVVAITDMAEDVTYPDFSSVARRHGVSSSLSVGMPVPRRTVGALNLYCTGDRPADEEAVQLAQVFASYAAVALANASLYSSTAELATQMQQAMASRAVIEQAKGIVMGQLGIGPDEAFAHLSRTSQQSNRKLRDVAAAVVEQVQQKG
jgi:GAF domain-containing protein